jgi:disulfide bond formation protein DsbB
MNGVLGTVLLVAAVAGDAAFLWAYAWRNRWWTGRPGRALVGLGVGVLELLAYGALRRLFGWSVVGWVQVVQYAVVVVIVWGLAAAFLRERWARRQ